MGRWADSLGAQAAELLPQPVLDYVRQGARDGISAAEAEAAWDRTRFRPAVLRDVTGVDTSAQLLGTEVAAPIAVAPTTMQRAVHHDGEVAMARAAQAAGSLLCVSSNAGTRFDAIAETGVDWWLQAYLTADRSVILPVLESAAAAGARAVVLTADTPVVGTKYDADATVWDVASPDWLRVNFGGAQPGDEKAMDLGPADIRWLGEVTGLPVVVKGVLRPDDARRCVEAGASGVWVSNHGGRQLDRAIATADALAQVAIAVGGDAEVYVDGGVRNAHHVVTALARGAGAVFLGRPTLYALAVDGASGVQRLLAELGAELVETLQLLGCGGLADIRALGVLAEPIQLTRE